MESVHASLCERLCIPTCLSRISVRVKGRMSARIKERMSARIKERMPASVKELIPARLNHNPSNGRLQKVTTSPSMFDTVCVRYDRRYLLCIFWPENHKMHIAHLPIRFVSRCAISALYLLARCVSHINDDVMACVCIFVNPSCKYLTKITHPKRRFGKPEPAFPNALSKPFS